MNMSNLARMLCAGLLAVALAGCATNRSVQAQGGGFNWSQGAEKRIAIIQPTVHLGELTASGMVEARADWTKTAEQGIDKHLKAFFEKRGTQTTPVKDIADPHEIQIVKLHFPVGNSVIKHALMGVKLPNKTTAMDWTLGPGAAALRDHYGADYALFMNVEDTYTSAGRVLLIFVAAAANIHVQGGNQVAFASLVDLRTGNIVWFNVRADQGGDLRNDKGAKSFIDGILADLPK
jgi:hypothetical protein